MVKKQLKLQIWWSKSSFSYNYDDLSCKYDDKKPVLTVHMTVKKQL